MTLIKALQKEGNGPPLFLFPGSGGNYMVFRTFRTFFKGLSPVYVVIPKGLDGMHPPFKRIDERIDEIEKSILAIQPKPPYFLLGYCFGGRIAFKVAQRIAQSGASIGLLGLVETRAPGVRPAPSKWTPKITYSVLKKRIVDLSLEILFRASRSLNVSVPIKLREQYLRYWDFRNVSKMDYGIYKGEVILFWCEDFSQSVELDKRSSFDLELNVRCWKKFIDGNILVHKLPGNHETILTSHSEPFALQIVDILSKSS
jgi:thioesterase domain-containing protein